MAGPPCSWRRLLLLLVVPCVVEHGAQGVREMAGKF